MILSASEFAALRSSTNSADQLRATHDDAPISVWRAVIESYPELKTWVVHNKTVPGEILHQLATDSEIDVRWEVATKRKLAPETFAALTHDPDESVRARLARNPKITADLLDAMKRDESKWVREVVAEVIAGRSRR